MADCCYDDDAERRRPTMFIVREFAAERLLVGGSRIVVVPIARAGGGIPVRYSRSNLTATARRRDEIS